MAEALIGLLGALIGGAIAIAGSLYSDTLRDKRERARIEADRVRTNAYAVQDAIAELFEQYHRALMTKWPNKIGSLASDPEHARSIRQINIATVRVGDQPLADKVGALLDELGKAIRAESVERASACFNEAYEQWTPVNDRMGELLYGGAPIDTGVKKQPE